MDPVTMIYYGGVGGMLAWLGSRVPSGVLRFALGVVVGFVAAAALPLLRRAAGL